MDYAEYKGNSKEVKVPRNAINSINKAVTYHIRNLSASMPYRLAKKIYYNQQQLIQTKLNSTKNILTLRSVLLHFSDNFLYLFALHLSILPSMFGRASLQARIRVKQIQSFQRFEKYIFCY